MTKTFSIKTLGCKLNQYESSRIAHDLQLEGWSAVPFGEPADLVIVNTCTVTDRSDKKCRNYIRQGARFARTGTALVTGCLARRDAATLSKMPQVGSIAPGTDRAQVRRAMAESGITGPVLESEPSVRALVGDDDPLPFRHTRAFLKIQDGCDGTCSYCIVPSVRGEPVSRSFAEVLDHARRLIDHGCPEIVLTGITIGRYFHGGRDLPDLLEALCALEGNFRIRVTSIEPNHVSERLVSLIGQGRVCRHIHLPLQSGSDRVLRRMNRPYDVHRYLGIIDSIRKKDPEIAIGTDIIVGFPGESDADFRETLDLVGQAGFAYVHQFSFSPRTGTPAALSEGKIDERTMLARSNRLKEAGMDSSRSYRARFLARTLSCVIERDRSREGFTAVSDNYIRIELNTDSIDPDCAGTILPVRVTALTGTGARGERADASPKKC